jgi:hypothetical protein
MTRSQATILVLLSLALPSAASERQILLRQSFAYSKPKVRERQPLRARFIEPDFNVLTSSDKKLTIALFDDVVLHVELTSVERDATGTALWSGRVEGDDNSSVLISVKDHAMSAAFWTSSRRFSIEPGENGTHEALEIDARTFPDESEPQRAFVAARSTIESDALVTPSDTAEFFDVLVVYTDDLRASLGGTAAAQTAASNAVGAMNTAYANSGVTARARLVGTAEVNYAENGDMQTALYALRNGSDGLMDEVPPLRTQLGADAVSMLVLNGGGSCGIGFLMSGSPSSGFASNAYNVVANNCATGNLSLAHEFGHNFGLEHDRYVATGQPAYTYAFGYVDTSGQFRDVMAYASACGGCPRIQYFSNPDRSYLNRPLGVNYQLSNSADNARALNNAASVIANWRQSVQAPPTPPVAVFTDDPAVAQSTPIKALHITELQTAINAYRAYAGLSAVSWTPIATGTIITAAHILELRNALTPALVALNESVAYTDTSLSGVAVKATHIQELRNYLK